MSIERQRHRPDIQRLADVVDRAFRQQDARKVYPIGTPTSKARSVVVARYGQLVRVDANGVSVQLPRIDDSNDIGRMVVVLTTGNYSGVSTIPLSGATIEGATSHAVPSGYTCVHYLVADLGLWVVSGGA